MSMVEIEKRRVVLVNRLVDGVNKAAKKAKRINLNFYTSLINKKDITIETKKRELIKRLNDLLVKTFPNKKLIKNNIKTIRKLITKLRDINYYLQRVFLKEIGLKQKKARLVEEGWKINKRELNKLEYAVFELIEKIVFIDNKLLKKYKKKEGRLVEDKKAEAKDLKKLLRKESELLCHIEAKLPPKKKFDERLLHKSNYGHWVASIFALLASFEHSYEKEILIFRKLKQNKAVKKKLRMKIKHIYKEKRGMLKLKEEKILAAKKLSKLDSSWEKILHEWTIASRL